MREWTIYYEDGTVQHSVWDSKNGVVAIVVFGADLAEELTNQSSRVRYRTLFYEDEDDAETAKAPFFFWRTDDGEFGAGYETPQGASAKRGADILARDHEATFALIDQSRG